MFRSTAVKWNLDVLRVLKEVSGNKAKSNTPPVRQVRKDNEPKRVSFSLPEPSLNTDEDVAKHIKVNYNRHLKSTWMGSYSKTRGMRNGLLKLYGTTRRQGIVGLQTIECVMQFFSILGMHDRCLRIFNDTDIIGIKKTPQMYRLLISSFAKHGQAMDVLRYNRQLRLGFPSELTAADTIPVFTCLVRMRKRELAFKAGIYLIQKIGPHEDIYTQLLKNSRSTEEAEILLQEMTGFSADVNITSIHIAAAMRSCKSSGDVEGTYRIFNMSQRLKVGITDVMYTVLLNTLREATDTYSLRRMADHALYQFASYQPFFNLLQAFIDAGDLSNARMIFAAADSHNLSNNLRVFTQGVLCQGISMNHKAILQAFDARPLGKFTSASLKDLRHALTAAYVREHPSPCFAHMKVILDDKKRRMRTEKTFVMLSHSCLALKGFGVRVIWVKHVQYLRGQGELFFGIPIASTYFYKNIGKAIAIRVSDLIRFAGGKIHVIIDSLNSLSSLLIEVSDFLLENYYPLHCVVLIDSIIVVFGMLGKPEQVVDWLKKISTHETPTWTQALSPHIDVLQAICTLSGETEIVNWLIKSREEASAHRIYTKLLTEGSTDVLKAEYQYTTAMKYPSISPPLSRDQIKLLSKVENSATVAEALAILPGREGPSDTDEEGLPTRSLLSNNKPSNPQGRELTNDMLRWSDGDEA